MPVLIGIILHKSCSKSFRHPDIPVFQYFDSLIFRQFNIVTLQYSGILIFEQPDIAISGRSDISTARKNPEILRF